MCNGPGCSCSSWTPEAVASGPWGAVAPVPGAWAPGAAASDAWLGVDPVSGLTGTGTYLVTETCNFLATETGALLQAWTN